MAFRWSRIVVAIYITVVVFAGALAITRLVDSAEMPGLAAWELLVLGLPWSLALGTPMGRAAGGVGLAAIVVGAVVLNGGLLYAIVSALERWRRAA